jgi:hypothetical protein
MVCQRERLIGQSGGQARGTSLTIMLRNVLFRMILEDPSAAPTRTTAWVIFAHGACDCQ